MPEKTNPAADGGARTVVNAGQAGAAENTKNQREREADRAHPGRVQRAVKPCPACADPHRAMMFRQAPTSQVDAAVWFLRALIAWDHEPKIAGFLSEMCVRLLSKNQLSGIAEAALRRLGPEHLSDVARTLMRDAGWPRAFFLSLVEEARSWAAVETRDALKAYMLACFEALPMREQVAFLDYVAERWGMTGSVRGRGHHLKSGPANPVARGSANTSSRQTVGRGDA